MSGHDSRSGAVIACAVVSQVVSGIVLLARFYSRGVLTRSLGREDWCILMAWVLAIGYTVSAAYEAHFAIGQHMRTLSPEDLYLYMRTAWVNLIFYQLILVLPKVSILLLYIRVLTYNYAKRASYLLLAIVGIHAVLYFVSTVTICRPLQAFWDKSIEGKCYPSTIMWAAIGVHIGTDFLIFLLPIPVVVYGMTLPRKQKLGLLLVFALGFFVCVISTLRAFWIKELVKSPDPTWDYAAIRNWTTIEVNMAILVPCLIVLKPLVLKLRFQVLSSAGQTPEHTYNRQEEVASRPGRQCHSQNQDNDGCPTTPTTLSLDDQPIHHRD